MAQRTREQDREYQRARRARLAAAKLAAKADEPPPAPGPMSAAVQAQLALVPAATLERIPLLAAILLAYARLIDRPELPHLHVAAIRALGAGLVTLEKVAPTATPKSRLDEQRGRRMLRPI